MKLMIANVFLMTAFVSVIGMAGCGDEPDNDNGADTDTDIDTDSDTDADTDTDTGQDPPIDDLSVIVGKTFVLEIEENDWVEPNPAVGQEFGAYVPIFAFQFDALNGDDLEVTTGTVEDGAQDECNEAAPFTGAVSSNPSFQFGPGELQVIIVNEDLKALATIRELTIEGNFVSEGAAFEGSFAADMDAREIYPLFTELGTDNPTPDLVCEGILTFTGEPCEPCATDGAEYCFFVKALATVGTATDGLTLEQMSIDEVDPTCLEDVFIAE